MNRAILVKSCQRFRNRQDACQDSWAMPLAVGSLQRDGIDVWIAEGGHVENGMYADMGVCEAGVQKVGVGKIRVSCGDEYQNNSIKVRKALGVMLAAPIYFASLFICDDDTFVHPQRWLAHEPQGDLECRVFRHADGRQWVHGGAGWWMSRRLCELYVQECDERTSADDILVARIAAKHGIEMHDRPDLYGGDRYSGHNPPQRVAADNTLITCHHVQPVEMVKLWEATRGI